MKSEGVVTGVAGSSGDDTGGVSSGTTTAHNITFNVYSNSEILWAFSSNDIPESCAE